MSSVGSRPGHEVGAAALALAPGLGGDADDPALVALEHALAPRPVERVAFPYRLAGRLTADPPSVLQAAIAESAGRAAARAGVPVGAVAVGGRSMGALMASRAVAGGLAAAGLVLLSFPLVDGARFRAGRPRDGHFGDLALPCLFVTGTADPYAPRAALEAAAARISGPVTMVWLPGAGHDPARSHDAAVAGAVRAWLDGVGPVGAPPTSGTG